jgi:hypothetical protein
VEKLAGKYRFSPRKSWVFFDVEQTVPESGHEYIVAAVALSLCLNMHARSARHALGNCK